MTSIKIFLIYWGACKQYFKSILYDLFLRWISRHNKCSHSKFTAAVAKEYVQTIQKMYVHTVQSIVLSLSFFEIKENKRNLEYALKLYT